MILKSKLCNQYSKKSYQIQINDEIFSKKKTKTMKGGILGLLEPPREKCK